MPSVPQTVLGFDVGRRRIGVAVGQAVTKSASPLATLPSIGDQPDWSAIAGLIGQWQPDLIIVGLPLHADGTESESTRMAHAFAQSLQKRFNLPVILHDERLSSAEARTRLKEQRQAGQRRRRTQKADIDKMAAAIIVQSWLAENISHGE